MLNKLILVFLVFLRIDICISQTAQQHYDMAKEAFQTRDYAAYYSAIIKAHELHPFNQNILWHAGIAAALNSKPEESLEFVKKAININAHYDLNDSSLVSLRDLAGFRELIKTKEQLLNPVIHSDTAFVVDDRQIHIESVAYDPVGKALFAGSIHKRKIIKIDAKGHASDFATGGNHRMAAVFGLKVDEKKRVLWACTSAIPEMQQYDSTIQSTLYAFDIKSGAVLVAAHPQDTLSGHIFGDVALTSSGEVYVSDSRNNIIYHYDASGRKLVSYFSSPDFWNIQGLTFSKDDRYLYIADYIKGIFVLDTRSKQLSGVKVRYDLSLKGTDGIIFFDNSLISIQNGVQPNRVVRHFLSPAGSEVIHYEVIDNAHPAFGEPTIGSLAGETLYYIANSQWNGYSKGQIKPAEELNPAVILKYSLRSPKANTLPASKRP